MNFKSLTIAGVLATTLFGLTGQGASAATPSPAAKDLIIVNDFYNKLAFMDDGYIRFVEPVAMGKEVTKTPIGTWKVTTKVVNRPYYKGHIKGGDPRNPLGNRWLGLSVPGGAYGIHGHAVGNESSIGKDVSSGCIRLLNSTNVKLFPYVNIGTKVLIVNSPKSFQQIAADNKYAVKGFTSAQTTTPATTVLTGKFTGHADSNSFEVKTASRYEVIQRGNVNVKSLQYGSTYKFTVKKGPAGQNVLVSYTK
ncbi:L,D-transpeptidase [Priestia megaterium]|uniref:L,D-transpeptidase n=1 Tax=Priestia megaterium TaxID=1404 RepID=UPI00300B8374